MLTFLKALDPKVWLAIGCAILFAVYTGAVYHAGGIGPRADLAKLQTSIKTAKATRDAEDTRKAGETAATITKLEGEKDDAIADAADAWSAYNGLQSARGRPGKGAKPVRPDTKVCDSADANNRLSGAIQSYRAEVAASLDELYESLKAGGRETGQLLEVAGKQAIDFNAVKKWAIEARRINSAP